MECECTLTSQTAPKLSECPRDASRSIRQLGGCLLIALLYYRSFWVKPRWGSMNRSNVLWGPLDQDVTVKGWDCQKDQKSSGIHSSMCCPALTSSGRDKDRRILTMSLTWLIKARGQPRPAAFFLQAIKPHSFSLVSFKSFALSSSSSYPLPFSYYVSHLLFSLCKKISYPQNQLIE